MKNKTTRIALALACLLVAMTVAACGNENNSDTTSEKTETEATTTTSAQITTVVADTTDAPVTTTALSTNTLVTTATQMPETTTTSPETTDAPVTATPVTTDTPVTTAMLVTTTEPPITTDSPVTEAPHTHTYGAWTTTKSATCTVEGQQKRTCTSCSATETKAIAALGHSYGKWTTTKEATCTEEGSQKRTCSTCSAAETKAIAALGHDWSNWETVKAPTSTTKGSEKRTCDNCGATETREIPKLEHTHSYGPWVLNDDYINETRTCSCGTTETQIHYADPETDERLVADRVIYYINEYRKKEGSTTVEKLDRLTLVAEKRSTYLVGLTSADPASAWHDIDDLREASSYYEYGRYIDPKEWGIDGEPFYEAPVGEAVGSNSWYADDTIDDVAARIARQCYNSSGHWSYVGSSDYSYIAVGLTCSKSTVYIAIFVCDTNQYE